MATTYYDTPDGMGEIQADGLGSDNRLSADYALGDIMFYGTQILAGYAARHRGHGWLATIGAAIGAGVLYTGIMVTGAFTGGFSPYFSLSVPAVAAYYAFKD